MMPDVGLLDALRGGPRTISPTAHYTGYVWAHTGLGPGELATLEGRVMYAGLQPLNWISDRLGGPTLPGALLSRHRRIDDLLTEGIESGRISQVVEIASGMSPRGYRFTQRYDVDALTYVEADLPGMVARKKKALARLSSSPSHRVVEVDALRDRGPGSLEELLGGLDQTSGLAIVTEGLVNYLPTDLVLGLWSRVAAGLSSFEHGTYLSDYFFPGTISAPLERVAGGLLGVFVRSGTYLHFEDEASLSNALRTAGFAAVTVHHPEDTGPEELRRSGATVRVIEAT